MKMKRTRYWLTFGAVILFFIEALIKAKWLPNFPLTETLSAQVAVIIGYVTNRTIQKKYYNNEMALYDRSK